MKKIKYLPYAAFCFNLLLLSSCMDSDNGTGNDPSKNTPVVGNAINAFSFVVDASSFNYSVSHNVEINADTLAVGLTVSPYVAGSGSIIVRDGNNSVIYQRDLNSAAVIGEVMKIITMPKSIEVKLNNYSGRVVLGISGH